MPSCPCLHWLLGWLSWNNPKLLATQGSPAPAHRTLEFGAPKFGWLNALKNSPRNSSEMFSASTLGTGGVLGTKFTLPQYNKQFPYTFLSPQKDAYWKKWIALYNTKMLSEGDFLDLYTYGYDFPESYAIAKDGKMYYAFFTSNESPSLPSASSSANMWKGEVELRGLQAAPYKVVDYANNRPLGVVQGPTAKLKVEFADNLLLEATPVPASEPVGTAHKN